MKKVILLAVMAIAMVSCQSKKNEVKVDEFANRAPEFVDQTISIEGVAQHVCATSGRKLFLGSETSDESVIVMAGADIDKFDANTIGETYSVEGIVREMVRIDEAYLDEWEKQVIEMGVQEGTHICSSEQKALGIDNPEEIELADNPQMKQIVAYREQIAANNGQPLIFYCVECVKYSLK